MKVIIALKRSWSMNKARGVGAYTRELVHALQRVSPQDEFIPTSHDYSGLGGTLVHYPFFDPFFLTLPRDRDLPTVITIHDLIPLKYPRHFKRGLRGTIKWWIQSRLARRVTHIITDSEASKRDIVAILKCGPEKVTAIPLAPSGGIAPSKSQGIKEKLSLPAKYILYVGDINWNKNVEGLIEAFAQLREKDYDLVLVGKAFVTGTATPEWKRIMKAIDRSGRRENIHLIGFVDAADLPAVYANATLYVQPSWDEGFGLPVLEAMQNGCPVVSSNRGSLPEVGGNAALYCDPARDMPTVIDSVLRDAALQKKLQIQGRKHVKQFSWDKTAEETRQIYDKAIS